MAAFSEGRYADALQGWQRAAEGGDGDGALYVGLLHDLGRGVMQNAREARIWYERAATLGNPVAMFNIGVLHDSGTGVARDQAAAAEWYRRAARVGMPRAAYALGLMYRSGDGVPADREQARRYFSQALAGGITAARSHLAALGVALDGGKRDDAPAVASEQGGGQAAFDRAQAMLLRRTPGDAARAVALLREAARRGNLLAAYNLAYCYDKGIGVQADLQQAYVWYGRAAGSPTTTVKDAARSGMVSVAVRLDPAELAAAQSELAASPGVAK